MEKIIIGVCDDQLVVLEQLEQMILKYLQREKVEAKLLLFQSGEEVFPNSEILDVLFLDIEMPFMDGIEVGRYIRKKNKHCKIIMETSWVERFKEAFKIEAFRFVTKPFIVTEIEEALTDSLRTILGKDTIELFENRISHDIGQREIRFIRAYDGYVEVLVGTRKMRKDISLTKLEETLENALFYRINREYLVNLLYVESYRDGLVTINGLSMKVARRKKKDFERIYQQFDIEYRGG